MVRCWENKPASGRGPCPACLGGSGGSLQRAVGAGSRDCPTDTAATRAAACAAEWAACDSLESCWERGQWLLSLYILTSQIEKCTIRKVLKKILLTGKMPDFFLARIIYRKDRFWCWVFSIKNTVDCYIVTVCLLELPPRLYFNCSFIFKPHLNC